MALDAGLLRSSFDLVLNREPEVMRRFYRLLFQRYPRAGQLFGRGSMARQEQMFSQALVALLDRLEDGAWLALTLPALGARHAAYGVTDEMYGWVGECLLATFAEVAGPDWTAELDQAWTDAYRAVSELMMSGVEPDAATRRTRPTHPHHRAC